jgi:hypothetical protein
MNTGDRGSVAGTDAPAGSAVLASAAAGATQASRRVGRGTLRALAWLVVLATLLSAVLVAALAACVSDASDAGQLSRAVIDIDGTRINLAQVQGEQWLLAAIVVFLALFVASFLVLLVVPVMVLAPLVAAALACTAAVLAVGVVGGLLLSPLILLVWAVWRLSHPRKPVATMSA